MAQGDALVGSPLHQFATDVFWPIVNTNCEWFAAPFDDLVEAADDAFSRQREVYFNAQSFAVEVVQDVQQPELPSILQPVGHEIHGPVHIRRIWHGQSIGLVPLQPLARLDPEVQFKLTIDAVNAFMVPVMPPDIAQIKETQTEAPGLLCLRQSDQEIGNLLVLVVQPGAVTISCLTDLEGAAGKRNAHTSQRH